MSEEEDIVIEIADEDAAFMLKEGLVEKKENGELWLTKKGEEFIQQYMDENPEDLGDAE